MKRQILNKAFLGIAAIACFYTFDVSAWERTASSNCKKATKNCQKSADQCKKDNDKCQQHVHSKDMSSFESELTPYAKSIFTQFSDDRKTKAMDYADKNKMSPDDAVAKVAGTCMCP